ncbi:helix-turn-helix domain-containing protein [Paenibacillus sp. GCM10023252]|uniref:helix-turn-helix domain-containing protein n=1 Tax=Paenibacillus sp. GCM10023252 TaxID=3252649 RepID=UPI00361A63D4
MIPYTKWELNPLAYGKTVCEPSWKWQRMDLPFTDYDLWYVWRGEGYMHLNGRTEQVHRGDCYLFRPEDLTYAGHDPNNPLHVTYIHFSAPEGNHSLERLPSRITFDDPTAIEAYLDRYVVAMNRHAEGYEQESNLLMNLMLHTYEREAARAREHDGSTAHPLTAAMTDVAVFIRENPGRRFNLAELAAIAHLSPRYFSLKFKEVMGITAENYSIARRIERAEYLLRHHGMTVGEVADALGYQSIYFFSRQFKQVTGIPPSQVKKR